MAPTFSAASGDAAAVAGRHADHQLGRVARARAQLGGSDGATAIAEVEDALPELAFALGHLLEVGETERAGRLLLELDVWGYLRLRPDVLAWSERVLAADPRTPARWRRRCGH